MAVEAAVFADQPIVSAVNYSETLQKLARLGIEREFTENALNEFEVVVASLNQQLAYCSPELRRQFDHR